MGKQESGLILYQPLFYNKKQKMSNTGTERV